MVMESEVERDRVEFWVAPVRQRLGAQHDDAARVDFLAGVSGHAVVRHQRVRRAEQQDAAALGGHRRVLVLLAELVVVEDAVEPMVALPAPPRWPSSRTRIPWQFPLTTL